MCLNLSSHIVLLPITKITELNKIKMQKIAVLTGDEGTGEHSRTFVIQDEGHTMGNVLKSIISNYPDVDFCGYTIPHPQENKMNFRIQANRSSNAIEILKRGLMDLEKMCDATTESFETALSEYKLEEENKMDS